MAMRKHNEEVSTLQLLTLAYVPFALITCKTDDNLSQQLDSLIPVVAFSLSPRRAACAPHMTPSATGSVKPPQQLPAAGRQTENSGWQRVWVLRLFLLPSCLS